MIPKPIYELLPYLYVAAGIAAILLVDSFMSFISGILMGITGILVMCMRRNFRSAKQAFISNNLQAE